MNQATFIVDSESSTWGTYATATQAERYAEYHAQKLREWLDTEYPDADVRVTSAMGRSGDLGPYAAEISSSAYEIMEALDARSEKTWLDDASECEAAHMAAAARRKEK